MLFNNSKKELSFTLNQINQNLSRNTRMGFALSMHLHFFLSWFASTITVLYFFTNIFVAAYKEEDIGLFLKKNRKSKIILMAQAGYK